MNGYTRTLLAAIAVVLTLLTMAASFASRLSAVEERTAAYMQTQQRILEAQRRLEQQNAEILQRLARIEAKLEEHP